MWAKKRQSFLLVLCFCWTHKSFKPERLCRLIWICNTNQCDEMWTFLTHYRSWCGTNLQFLLSYPSRFSDLFLVFDWSCFLSKGLPLLTLCNTVVLQAYLICVLTPSLWDSLFCNICSSFPLFNIIKLIY